MQLHHYPSCRLGHGEPQGLWLGKGHTQSQAHIIEYQATDGIKCKPKAGDGVTHNQELACGDKMERSWAQSARVLHCKRD